MTNISFFAAGDPKGQPRPRAFAMKIGGKFQARVFDAGTAEGWKAQIAIAAKEHLPNKPFAGPVQVDLTFWFRRPKSHYRTGKLASQLRPDAPTMHIGKPDRDNLDKAVLDALTALRFWEDDCQVCAGGVRKFWSLTGAVGCFVAITPLVGVAGSVSPDLYERQVALAPASAMAIGPRTEEFHFSPRTATMPGDQVAS